MSKYDSLGHFLADNEFNEVRMTFEDIEKVLGFELPERSQHIRAWWSNNPSNNVMTKAWLAAGYKTEQVDIEGRKLVFRRIRPRAAKASDKPPTPEGKELKPRRHPAFGSMKGLTTIAPGTDLTAPVDPEWVDSL
jgi:hypothetical protein